PPEAAGPGAGALPVSSGAAAGQSRGAAWPVPGPARPGTDQRSPSTPGRPADALPPGAGRATGARPPGPRREPGHPGRRLRAAGRGAVARRPAGDLRSVPERATAGTGRRSATVPHPVRGSGSGPEALERALARDHAEAAGGRRALRNWAALPPPGAG